MKFKPSLQIAQNLFLIGEKVISYETHVATLELYSKELGRRPVLISKGKYSRTTGKHISQVMRLTGARLVDSAARPGFWRFEFGVKCQVPGTISPLGSKLILAGVELGYSLETAAALAAPNMSKRDLKILHSQTADLPELQQRIELCQEIAEFGLLEQLS